MAVDPDAVPVQDKFFELLSLTPIAKTAEVLEEIATNLDVNFEDVAGDKAVLMRLLMRHLNSDDFDQDPNRDDRIEVNFDRLEQHLGFKIPKIDPTLAAAAQAPATTTAVPQVSQPALATATAPAATAAPITITVANPSATPSSTSLSAATTMTSSVLTAGSLPAAAIKLKDFKIDGLIGSKDPAKRLTYTSLQHQVSSAQKRGYQEQDIIAAVIRCIPPGSSTRTYLEGRGSLSIDMVLTTLRAHFVEGKVTTLYEKLTHSVQGVDDSPLTFLMDSFALRDQILDLSMKQQDTDARYGRSLVQNVMQETLFTGLRDEGIRQHLRPFLTQKDVSDDVLIGEVTKAALEKDSRDAKFGLTTTTKKTAKVASVDNTLFATADRDESFLAQIKELIGNELKGQMVPLKAEVHNLRQEVASVNSKRKPNATPPASQNVIQHQGPLPAAAAPPQNSPNVTPNATPNITADDFMSQMFAHFQAMAAGGQGGQGNGSQGNGNYRGGGGGRGGRGGGRGGRGGGGRNGGTGSRPMGKCSMCRDANAVMCNHCLVCHEVTHWRSDCPKKNDPNWTPLN